MFTNRRILVCVVWLSVMMASLAHASIIDDKSDFVGDYTVIDFETRGDGTPLILEEGGYFVTPPHEYADLGVSISADFVPSIVNDLSPQADAAQGEVGSPPNKLFDGTRNAFLRFDFDPPVPAVGMALQNRTDGGPVRFQVFDAAHHLIEAVDFNDALIDGKRTTIHSSKFPESFGDLIDFKYFHYHSVFFYSSLIPLF